MTRINAKTTRILKPKTLTLMTLIELINADRKEREKNLLKNKKIFVYSDAKVSSHG